MSQFLDHLSDGVMPALIERFVQDEQLIVACSNFRTFSLVNDRSDLIQEVAAFTHGTEWVLRKAPTPVQPKTFGWSWWTYRTSSEWLNPRLAIFPRRVASHSSPAM
jgi:hypothetical protein